MTQDTQPPAVKVEVTEDGALHTLTVDRPRGNILTISLCEELLSCVQTAAADPRGKLLVIRGAGGNFSFGASVEEHQADTVEAMLAGLGELVVAVEGFPYPTLAAVSGRCLGGGLELALACGFLLATEDAMLGCPEIQLGVFPPAAAALLAGVLPRARFEELLLTGRSLSADECLRWGLANQVVPGSGEAPLQEAVAAFAGTHLLPRSTAALRIATTAARQARTLVTHSFPERLTAMERHYLAEVVPSHDGNEGIRAFLEKRAPVWQGR